MLVTRSAEPAGPYVVMRAQACGFRHQTVEVLHLSERRVGILNDICEGRSAIDTRA